MAERKNQRPVYGLFDPRQNIELRRKVLTRKRQEEAASYKRPSQEAAVTASTQATAVPTAPRRNWLLIGGIGVALFAAGWLAIRKRK